MSDRLIKFGVYITAYASIVGVIAFFIRQHFKGIICTNKRRLDGKVVLITGGSSGIGLETAKDLKVRGAKVYIACRDMDKAWRVSEEVNATIREGPPMFPKSCDLASFRAVREFVKTFIKKEDRLDILVNNAGIFWVPEEQTEDGFDKVFQVNFLGHFLLTRLLLEKYSPHKMRIVNLTSSIAKKFPYIFDPLGRHLQASPYSKLNAYAQSKLAMMRLTEVLAYKYIDINVCSVNPGTARTNMFRTFPLYTNWFLGAIQWPFRFLVQRSASEAAQSIIYCCVNDFSLACFHFSDVKGKPLIEPCIADGGQYNNLETYWKAWNRETGFNSARLELLD